VTLYEVEATQGTGKSWSLSVWDGAKANAKAKSNWIRIRSRYVAGHSLQGDVVS
jgi:hypothetical protein